MFLRSDLFYETKLRLRKICVCTKHKEELLKEYRISKYRNCSVCVRGFGKSSPSTAVQNISPVLALTVYEQLHVQHSYGMPICRRCREEVLKRCDQMKIDKHRMNFGWLKNVIFSDEESDDTIDDQEYQPSPVSAISSASARSAINSDKNKRSLFKNFIQLMRPERASHSLMVTRSYAQLTKKSKRNFLSHAKFVVDAVVEYLAGDDAAEVLGDLYSYESRKNKVVMDSKLMNILSSVAEAYENADSSVDRRTILSIVAKQIDYNLLSSVIPGLTRYRYTAARLYSEEYGTGKVMMPISRVYTRFSIVQVEHFIDFVLSSHISTDLPFGEKTLKLSSGTTLNVPDIIRSMNSTRIIQQYNQ